MPSTRTPAAATAATTNAATTHTTAAPAAPDPHPGQLLAHASVRPAVGIMQVGDTLVTVTEQLTSSRNASAPLDAWLIAEDDSDTYRSLVAAYPETGLWPVRSLMHAHLNDVFNSGEATEGTSIRSIFGLDDPEWPEQTFCFECGPHPDRTGELSIPGERSDADALADILDDPGHSLKLGLETFWRYASHERIALVQARSPSEFPLATSWSGAVNWQQPCGDVAVVLRSWQQRFGAYPYSATDSTMELVVARPPRTIHEARMVGRELLHFCPYDTQSNGFDGVDAYCRKLIGSHWWHFWWD